MTFKNLNVVACERFGVRIPALTDPVKKGIETSTVKRKCECHGSSKMTIINGCLVSQLVWHVKETKK